MLISCKMLKWKPRSQSFFLGLFPQNHVFSTIKHKPHDINNNTAQNPELHQTHFWQQQANPGGEVCFNNHLRESREWHLVESRAAGALCRRPPPLDTVNYSKSSKGGLHTPDTLGSTDKINAVLPNYSLRKEKEGSLLCGCLIFVRRRARMLSF